MIRDNTMRLSLNILTLWRELMKISQYVRDKYMELCPVSTMKCDTYEEIDYKIKRAVDLGKVVYTYPCRVIQYFNLRFTVEIGDKENTVIDMEKNDDYYQVDEYRKVVHECKYYNIVV
jgi:hypothetical protein